MTDHRGSDLGPEQGEGDRSKQVDPAPPGLESDLARVGAIPASNEVVDAALRLVVMLADATVQGANGVSVSLERHGQLRTVAASNDTVMEMDRHQYETGEGPCVAAAAEGRWYHIESMRRESRWPAFVPKAVGQGIASILSTPLKTGERALGALNIYSDTEHVFGTGQQELAALFATQASGILADAGADVSAEQLGERIADALRSRETIARATGVLMERRGLTAARAVAALQAAARDREMTVRQHADGVVRSAGRGEATTAADAPYG